MLGSALGLVEGPEGCGPLPVGLLVVGHELDTRLVPGLNVGEAGQLHPAHVARGPGYHRGYIVSKEVIGECLGLSSELRLRCLLLF